MCSILGGSSACSREGNEEGINRLKIQMHRKFRINAKCLIPTEIVAMKETKSNRLETHKGER